MNNKQLAQVISHTSEDTSVDINFFQQSKEIPRLNSMMKSTGQLFISGAPPKELWTTIDYAEETSSIQFNQERTVFSEAEDIMGLVQRKVVRLDPPVVDKSRFIPLQVWEGAVISKEKDSFTARLFDETNEDEGEKEVEIEYDEISEDDLNLLEPGAIFNWYIGYQESAFGQRERKSTIVFRRLPAWTKREIEEAKGKTQRIKEILDW